MSNAIQQLFEFVAVNKTSELSSIRDDIEDVRNATDDLNDASGRSQQASAGAERGLNLLSTAAKAAGAALAAAAAIGFGAMLAASGQAFRDFMALDTAMNRFEAQTGLTGDALDGMEQIAVDLFTGGWGDSLDEVITTLSQVRNITQLEGQDLKEATQAALIFSDTFERDITESVRGADTMMDNFGVTAQESFDILTRGMQATGDPAGDLLDTFNEYSANFADMGFSARQMLAILQTGLQAGARNTDDIADGMREFQIRLQDGSSDLALWQLGLSGINQEYKNGERSGKSMFLAVRNALLEIEDPLERNRLGVELFGTKWEDVGPDVFLSLNTIGEGLSNVEGATNRAGDALQRGLGPTWERFTRTVRMSLVEALGPYIEQGLERLIPLIEQAGQWLTTVGIPKFAEFTRIISDGVASPGEFGERIAGGLESIGESVGMLSLEKLDALVRLLGEKEGLTGISPVQIAALMGAIALLAAPSIAAGLTTLVTTAIIPMVAAFTTLSAVIAFMLSPLGILLVLLGLVAVNFGGIADSIEQVIDGLKNGDLLMVLDGLLDTITAIPLGIADMVGGLLGIDVPEGLAALEGTWENIKTIISWVGTQASKLLGSIDFEIPGAIKDLANIMGGIAKAADTVANTLGLGGDTSGGDFNDLETMIGKKKARGGPLRGVTLVGEEGPEFIAPGYTMTAVPAAISRGYMGAGAGSGGGTVNEFIFTGDMHFNGVQNIRQLQRELEAEAQRVNRR